MVKFANKKNNSDKKLLRHSSLFFQFKSSLSLQLDFYFRSWKITFKNLNLNIPYSSTWPSLVIVFLCICYGLLVHIPVLNHVHSGDQTYKHFLFPFCNFDPFWFIFYDFFRFTLSCVPYYLHIFTMIWAGRKNVGTFIN